MRLIALDCSGLVASVAILDGENVIAEYNTNYNKTHSQTILPMLEELKDMLGIELDTIDAIAIANGPGSFTGLRIGAATAKGLAMALNIPIIEIGTLEGMACNLYGSEALIVPMMDARRSQVYTGIYSFEFSETDSKYELKEILKADAISVDDIVVKTNELAAMSDKKVVFLGDGVPVYIDRIKELSDCKYTFAPAHMNRQRAASFGFLAMDKLNKGETVDYRDHAPVYLRQSQAEQERNEGKRNKGSNY